MNVRRRPRILFVTGHLPYPPVSGGRLREYQLIRRLAGSFDLRLAVVSKTPQEDKENAGELSELCSHVDVTPARPEDGPQAKTPVPDLVVRHSSKQAAGKIARAIGGGDVDVVHVEGFYLLHLVPTWCSQPVLLVEQNVEYMLCHQRVHRLHTRTERELAVVQHAATLQWEIEAWRRADVVGAVTEEDRDTMVAADPTLDVRLLPDGADHALGAASAPLPAAGGPTLVYVGNFGYAPNVDAALYLCEEIFPRVRRGFPTARLVLVGNAPPDAVSRLASDAVTVTGRVPAVEPYLDAADVAIFPLREGGGVKVKVIEALARGKAVVTTPLGLQGLGAAREAVEVHETPRKLAAAVVGLLEDPDRRRELERAAKAAAASLPTWDDAASALASCYTELAARRTSPEARPSHPAG